MTAFIFWIWYNECIINTKSLEELIEIVTRKGGRINSFYLQNPKKGPSLVFYKQWYRGKNLRDALVRALAGELS
ncbi:hypothetical protein HY468_03950 [Candidatus Roizmanbacteria bacterium]|nr:hypothetical protein [Candidatus Roizmanbacteria bacterium]